MDGAVHFAGWRAVEDRRKLSRVYTMYHGTHVDSAEDIIINGFKPSTIGLLGKGVYLTRNFLKARRFPLRTDQSEQVVLKLKVDVGRVKKIDYDYRRVRATWQDEGYDCAWVSPFSDNAVLRAFGEESCVRDPKRVMVVDVVFCLDQGKRRKLRNLIQSHTLSTNCPLCLQSFLDSAHELRYCWACGEMVCPFEKEHMCVKQN